MSKKQNKEGHRICKHHGALPLDKWFISYGRHPRYQCKLCRKIYDASAPVRAKDCFRKSGIKNPPPELLELKSITTAIKKERKKQKEQQLEEWIQNLRLDNLSKL